MKKILTLFVLVLTAAAVRAQSGEISGTVKDEKGEGMISATVIIIDVAGKNTGVGAVTDFDGNYSIKPLKPGKYDVQYSYAGYASQIQKGVYVKGDQPTFLNIKLNPSDKVLDQVEVIAYKIPLIDRASTTNAATLSKEDIAALPTQNVTDLVSTTAGAYQEDANKGISIRGGREDGTEYYIDGIKVLGKANIPVQSIEQLTVITGGVPARYGDATGGIINITTKGPSGEFTGGVSVQTSQGLDAYGYNQANANLLGPIIKSKKQNRTILGFSSAFEFLDQKDRSPASTGVWQVKNDVLSSIKDAPLYRNPTGTNFIFKSENLTFQDLYKTAAKPNNDQRDYKGVLTFSLSPKEGINLSFGGNASYGTYHSWVREYTLLNAENNPLYKELNYKVFGKFTHNVSDAKARKNKGAEEKPKVIQNVSYTLQADYEKYLKTNADESHDNRYFDYGYIGKFETEREVNYIYDNINLGGKDYQGYVQSGDAKEVNVAFTPGAKNPLGARFTEQYFTLLGATKDANGTYRLSKADAVGFAENINQIEANRGLINGQRSEPIYNLWYNIGRQYNGSGVDANNEQIRARVETSFDILKPGSSTKNKHSIEIGLEYEQRVQRTYSINPLFLWDIARTNVNKHLSSDTSSAVFKIGGVEYGINDPSRPDFYFTDSIRFDQKADLSKQGYFDRNLRKALGMDPNGTQTLDLYAVDPSKLSISQFSATELLSFFAGGGDIINYKGYDYTGKVVNGRPTINDFFKAKNEDGQYTRLQDAYRPIYASAYISDKFYYKDLGFMVGLRVDRFDANQEVLKDPYSLYDIKTKGEVSTVAGTAVTHPGSVSDNAAVYLSKYGDGGSIAGYRQGDVWYDKYGNVSTPRAIGNISGEGALPYVNLPNIDNLSTADVRGYVQKNPDLFDPSGSFTRYKAKYIFMPRLQFSFNITDNAQFFAHYDVLSQRPQSRNQLNLAEYFYWSENTGYKNNPNLKPETTVDYEFGFKQKLTKSSVVTLSAYYKEFRNMIQVRKLQQAFPSTYLTFDNIDFVSVKGINVVYDLRRTGNFKANASYTLQFAEGTGSDDASQQFLVDADVANFRTIFPVNYDARHQLNITLDYRFAEGKNYNGPVIKNKQILANFGVNLVLRTRSGTPYSTSTIPTDQGSIGGGTRQNTSSLNGPRLPWSFRADLRVNKDFAINVARKGEDKDPKKLYFSVYVWIQNLFNTQNVLKVYRYTGSPSDDGFLDSPQKQVEIASKYNPQAYTDLYRATINNPDNYSLPRRIYLGASFNF
jgi:outer membrane receptor protein involved in Fe transport